MTLSGAQKASEDLPTTLPGFMVALSGKAPLCIVWDIPGHFDKFFSKKKFILFLHSQIKLILSQLKPGPKITP